MIDTPDGIAYYQLCVHCARLRIEVRTGMTSRVNTLQSAQQKYGQFIPGDLPKTRKKMLAELEILQERVLAGEVSLL
jgi:hypothetical protein